MKHNYEERKAKRIEYAKLQAAKNQNQSDQLYKKAKQMGSIIPMGQPILIGHHSEKADRRYRDKIHHTFGKSFQAADKANYYEEKAKTIESNHAISSDDPEALNKLREKLNELEKMQTFMKAANKCIRSKDKAAFLQLAYGTEENWEALNQPDVMNHIGFAGYRLTNNSSNIRRIKDRIKQLEKLTSLTTTETTIGGIRILSNVEANRVQIFFPSKPEETMRDRLKQNGFRWSPSEGAWQRQLSNYAYRLAMDLVTNFINTPIVLEPGLPRDTTYN